VGTDCLAAAAICGDGLLGAGEQCDDGNLVDGDGCSSSCFVEAGHSCLNNASLSTHSVCYYSQQLALSMVYVYKVPLQNSVQLTVAVSAPDANQQLLQDYLETQTAVGFQNSSRRLLLVAEIGTRQAQYDPGSQILTVSFDFVADVTLPAVALQFGPSLSAASNSYFATPQATAVLDSPSNKLLTTFMTDTQIV
jgi:cysteine-rich repeat protein